jgi:hypothetical protein
MKITVGFEKGWATRFVRLVIASHSRQRGPPYEDNELTVNTHQWQYLVIASHSRQRGPLPYEVNELTT